jgi:hypothetical protein
LKNKNVKVRMKGRKRIKGDVNNPAFLDWKKDRVDGVKKWFQFLCVETSVWGLETLKHIALVSLSGLAGVFALLSTKNLDSHTAVTCARLFAIASGLCVLGMYFGYLSRGLHIDHQNELLSILYEDEMPSAEENRAPARVVWIGWASDTVGWIAAILTGTGGILLFNSL